MSLGRSFSIPVRRRRRSGSSTVARAEIHTDDVILVNFKQKAGPVLMRSVSSHEILLKPVVSDVTADLVEESRDSLDDAFSITAVLSDNESDELNGIRMLFAESGHEPTVGDQAGQIDSGAVKLSILNEENLRRMDELLEGSLVSDLDIDMCFRELPFYGIDEIPTTSNSDSEEDIGNAAQKAIQTCALLAEGYQMPFAMEGQSDGFWDDEELDRELYENASQDIIPQTWCCYVCYESYPGDNIMLCMECDSHFCFQCMASHVDSRILQGDIHVFCPGAECKRDLSNQMIAAFAPNLMTIFKKNLIELENNPFRKTCPNCHKVVTVTNKAETKVQCSDCRMFWCFSCHAPWHSGLTCKSFQSDSNGRGKRALKYWAKSKGKEHVNAQKCPKCKFFIERISGCDHMTCSKCRTEFCYKCGGKHHSAGYLGNHYSRLSFLGCKYNLQPNNAPLRIAIRSAVATGVVIGAPVVGALLIGAGGLLLGLSPLLVPYCVIRKCNR